MSDKVIFERHTIVDEGDTSLTVYSEEEKILFSKNNTKDFENREKRLLNEIDVDLGSAGMDVRPEED